MFLLFLLLIYIHGNISSLWLDRLAPFLLSTSSLTDTLIHSLSRDTVRSQPSFHAGLGLYVEWECDTVWTTKHHCSNHYIFLRTINFLYPTTSSRPKCDRGSIPTRPAHTAHLTIACPCPSHNPKHHQPV